MNGNLSKRKGLDSSLTNADVERIKEKLFERYADSIPKNVSDLVNDSGYLTEHQDISGKVDKVDGKGLSSNDYTDEEREKLAGLNNYDDTAIKAEIAENTEARHTHENKTVLDNITEEKVNKWDSYQEYDDTALKLHNERLKYYGNPDIVPYGYDEEVGYCWGSFFSGTIYDEENKTAMLGIDQGDLQFISPNVKNFDGIFVVPYRIRKDGVDYLVTGIIDYGFCYEKGLNCSIDSLKSIILPRCIETIGNYSFGSCDELENQIDLRNCTSIGDNAFTSSSSKFAIRGYNDSAAETYAKDNELNFIYLETDVDKAYVDEKVGDIETALDSIIAIQNELIGGESA